MTRLARLVLIAGTLAAGSAASAQYVPPNLETPHVELPPADQPPRVVPIVSYTLALIWAPQHCFHAVGGAEALQCGRDTGSGFVLHGLWPDGEGKNWPQWCGDARVLPRSVIAAYYRATPSPQLLQHEWAKHGTCVPGMTPDSYFRQSSRLFFALRSPDMDSLAKAPLTEGQLVEAFAPVNPGTSAESIRLNLDKQGWLQAVWFCLDTNFRATRCAAPAQPARVVQIRN